MIARIFGMMMFERPARKMSYDDYATALKKNGDAVANRIENGANADKAHSVATHFIGIEKWAQSRLRVALGEPFKADEYDAYRPAKELDYAELLPIFRETRAESIALAQQLAAQNVPTSTRVKHNQFGDFSTRAWLHYIMSHGDFESKRLEKGK